MATDQDMQARGREGARVRQSCALPLAWRLMDDARLRHIMKAIDRRLDDATIATTEVAGIMRLLMIFQTGRSHEQLGRMRVQHAPALPLHVNHAPGILLVPEGAVLLVRNTHPHRQPDSPFLILPALPALDRAARIMSSCIHDDMILCPGVILDAALDKVRHQLLKGGTKAEGGDAALRRWLAQRMRDIDHGDPAAFAILNPDTHDAGKTTSAYHACNGERHWDTYAKALAPVAPTLPPAPHMAIQLRYGTRHCPTDAALRMAIDPLLRQLARPAIEPRLRSGANSDEHRLGSLPVRHDRHVAMMIYSFALVSFGTGQRGRQSMPGSPGIDPETGFSWVIEKGNPRHGSDGAHGVYHCRLVRQQIAAYERYCEDLADMFARAGDACAAKAIRHITSQPGLRFFDHRAGGIVELMHSELCRLARARFAWPFTPGAGRKWLRSAIAGTAPSDAIAAQFGHHHDGFSVWSTPSALRPGDVRIALKQAIGPALEKAGFRCSIAQPPPLPRLSPAAPNFFAACTSQRAKAGRITASAMWHGALLDKDRRDAVLEAAQALRSGPAPEWFDLDRRGYAAQDRWFIDPHTRALMDERRRDWHQIAGKVDEILCDFLGSPKQVETFKTAAEHRWRFRLPPVLFALAAGNGMGNHPIAAESFDPDVRRRSGPARRRPDRRHRRWRSTGDDLLRFIERCWQDTGTLATRKKVAHGRGRALPEQSFFARMSPFERSLAIASLAGFQADRRHPNPPGDHWLQIRRRVQCLWHDVVPLTRETWEDRPLEQFDLAALKRVMNSLAPWRGNAANALATLLIDSGARRHDDPIVKALRDLDRSYTADVLRPGEYETALSDASPIAADALILSYRAGLRFEELQWSDIADSVRYRDVDTIVLDHSPYHRLKTFESRRRIPIGLLIPPDERRRLRARAIDPTTGGRLKTLTSAYDPTITAPLEHATGRRFNLYPLRHAFATNAYAAMLWPSAGDRDLERFFDPHLLRCRKALRRHVCGDHSLGATTLYAVAMMMGHTHPSRTLFSYVHHLEVILAAWIRQASPKSDSISR